MRHPDDHDEEPVRRDAQQFGCTASGDDLLAIGQALRAAVGEHLIERQRTPHALVLRIAGHAGAACALRDYARREEACCSFFDIAVTEDDEMLSVKVSGPPESAPLLDLLYQLAEPVAAAP
jgi:hypothetical protein